MTSPRTLACLIVVVAGCSGGSVSDERADVGGGADMSDFETADLAADASSESNPDPVFASNYEQACGGALDCALVYEGDPCACGGNACVNAAIAGTELETWNQDRATICPDESQSCSAAPCPERLPTCVGGTCGLREPVIVDASDWDRSCAEDSDCLLIFEGEICATCQCETAVNVSNRETYEELRARFACPGEPDSCGTESPRGQGECPNVYEAWCNAGTCDVGGRP